ncbi:MULTISPECIES: regulatory protein RecX [unclassified Acinetobacter]|uniref:regulatory protein RecX n=1 Tax=unclassified Acinetobacter TaxID=196816 RepID=UPI0035B6B8CD
MYDDDIAKPKPSLKGQKLRSTAFALLAKREYSKQDLFKKLLSFGADADELTLLIDELAEQNYQSDERMAGMLVRSQIQQGRGLARIQQNLKKHAINPELAEDALEEIDWLKQAYQLKVRKFGSDVTKDPKLKAKQIRFLQYRGFSLDIVFKAVQLSTEEAEERWQDEFFE